MGKLLIGIGVIFALMGVFGSMIPLVILGKRTQSEVWYEF